MTLVDDKYRDLMAAAHHNDLPAFEKALSRANDDETWHPHRCTYAKTLDSVIHVIAQLGHVKLLDALLQRFPNDLDLEIRNVDSKTPLHEAAQFSQPAFVSALLRSGKVKVDCIKRADWTPLMLACTKTGPEALKCIDILAEYGANPHLVNKVRVK